MRTGQDIVDDADAQAEDRHDGGMAKDGAALPCPAALVDALVAQAMRDEEIIGRMREAVIAGDRNTVFELARELTCTKETEE